MELFLTLQAIDKASKPLRAMEKAVASTSKMTVAGASAAEKANTKVSRSLVAQSKAAKLARDATTRGAREAARAQEQLARQAERTSRALAASKKHMVAGFGNIGQGMRSSGRIAASMATGAGIAGAAAGIISRQLIGPAAKFEGYAAALESIKKPGEDVQKTLAWVSEFAAKTPYGIEDTTEAMIRMRAYGLEPMDGMLRTLGDTSSAMGKPLMQAVEAMADAVTGENERLKEFGIKASKVGDYFSYAFIDREGTERTLRALSTDKLAIQKALGYIFDSKYDGAMEKQSKTWNGIWAGAEDAWTRFQLMIMDAGLFDWMKGQLQGAVDEFERLEKSGELKKWATDIATTLKSGMIIGAEMAKGLWKAFQAIGKAASWAAEKLGGWENFGKVLVALPFLPALLRIASGIGQITYSLLLLGGTAGKLFAVFRLGVVFKALLIPLALVAKGFFTLGATIMATPIGWIIAGVAAVAGTVYLIYKNWDRVKPYFTALWKGVHRLFLAAWRGITGVLSGLWRGAISFAKNIWGGLTGFFRGLWNGITASAFMAWHGISGLAQSAWNGLTDFFGGLWGKIASTTSSIWQEIRASLLSVWQGITGLAQNVWGSLTGFFGDLWDSITTDVIIAWTNCTSTLQNLWQGVIGLAQSAWGSLTSFFGGLWNGITSNATTIWTNYTNTLQNLWQGATSILEQGWNSLRSWITGNEDSAAALDKHSAALRGFSGSTNEAISNIAKLDAVGRNRVSFDANAALSAAEGERTKVLAGLYAQARGGLFGSDFSEGMALTKGLEARTIDLAEYQQHLQKLAETSAYAERANRMLEQSFELDTIFKKAESAKKALAAVKAASDPGMEVAAQATPPVAPQMPIDLESTRRAAELAKAAIDAIPPALQNALQSAKSFVASTDFTSHGVRLMETLAAGIRQGARTAVAAVADTTRQMRDYLPHSPAKTGPLSDLHRVRFSETLALAIRPSPAVTAAKKIAAGMLAAVPLTLPAPTMAHFTAPQDLAWSLPSIEQPVSLQTQIPSPEVPSPALMKMPVPVALAGMSYSVPLIQPPISLPVSPSVSPPVSANLSPHPLSTGIAQDRNATSTPITINYSPKITIEGGNSNIENDFKKMLQEHADSIIRMVEEATRRKERRDY